LPPLSNASIISASALINSAALIKNSNRGIVFIA
jgi:hypothetical protein